MRSNANCSAAAAAAQSSRDVNRQRQTVSMNLTKIMIGSLSKYDMIKESLVDDISLKIRVIVREIRNLNSSGITF